MTASAFGMKERILLGKLRSQLREYRYDDRPEAAINSRYVEEAIRNLSDDHEYYGRAKQLADRLIQPEARRRIEPYDDITEEVLRLKRLRTGRGRQAELSARLEEEFIGKKDWWPIFATMTYSPENYHEAKEERQITYFLRKWKKAAVDITYCVVAEFGREHGRYHNHALIWCKQLPRACYDPAYGTIADRNGSFSGTARWWKLGRSAAMPVRAGLGDKWGLAGYRWPMNKYPTSTAAIATYMAKYASKEIDAMRSRGRREERTRMRCSQGLGMDRLMQWADALTEDEICLVLQATTNKMLARNNLDRIKPLSLLKKAVAKSLTSRNRKLAWKLAQIKKESLIERLKNSTQMYPRLNWQSITDTETRNLKPTADFSRIRQIYHDIIH